MERSSATVLLKHEDTWAFEIVGIFLNQLTASKSFKHVPDLNIVRRELIVSVLGHPNIPARHKLQNLLENLAHRNNVIADSLQSQCTRNSQIFFTNHGAPETRGASSSR